MTPEEVLIVLIDAVILEMIMRAWAEVILEERLGLGVVTVIPETPPPSPQMPPEPEEESSSSSGEDLPASPVYGRPWAWWRPRS